MKLRGTDVTLAAAGRSSGGTIAITYEVRVGTSICESAARARSSATAQLNDIGRAPCIIAPVQFPRFRLLVLVAVAAWLQGCNDLPRDPEGTSTRVAGARLRVGLIEQHPWVVRTSGEPSGVEVALVRELARELHAQPEWHWGGEELHMHALEKFELDLVVGGLTSRTPWKKHVGVTRPYFEDERAVGGKVLVQKHVMAVPPGENAWLKRVQEFLYRNRTEAARLAQSEAR